MTNQKLNFIRLPINDDDLLAECKIETYRSSGKGGQHANKTESAVRLTHIKSGLQVMCQDNRSQHLNKIKCIKELRKRIKQLNYNHLKESKQNRLKVLLKED